MQKIKPIIKNIKKYKNNAYYKARFLYTKYIETIPIDEDMVLFESFMGNNFFGTPFYIFMEIYNNSKYKNLKPIIAIGHKKREWLNDFLKFHNVNNVTIVERNSKEYCKALACAKYLVNNVTFPTYFVRRKGQVYWNTWHGTPLKALGRKIHNHPGDIGNVQRNFIQATHLSYANEYTFNHVREDYMLDNLYRGKYILGGYPANDIFFLKSKEEQIRKQLGLKNEKIVIYMPTWRDKEPEKKHNKQIYFIMHALYEFEEKLDDNTVVLVKLHHLGESMICFDDFKKIKPFPNMYETYEILNIANILITDYSSVMFDFLNKDRPIFLYTYDKHEYMNGRSMYVDIEKLPFYQTNNIYDLCNKINETNDSHVYSELKNQMCLYDNSLSTKIMCEYVFLSKKTSNIKIIPASNYYNNKKNILIFAGTLMKNGITTAVKSLLCNIDLDKYNYYIAFFQKAGNKHIDFINELDSKVNYIPIYGKKNLRYMDALCQYFYFRNNIETKFILKRLDHIFQMEAYRLFNDYKFDVAIHFSGYERKIIYLLPKCSNKTVINTHSDLIKEKQMRNNVHMLSIKFAYNNYDRIGVVNNIIKENILTNMHYVKTDKIVLMHNLNDISGIRMRSKLPVIFDEGTECNVSLEKLNNILKSNALKIINIARFSVEKGLDRLIEAFKKFNIKNPNSYLIIIGGHGNLYQDILSIANEINNIVIIKSMKNPMPILKKCDLFVLSSFYEGLPMTIMEALILNKPVISTDIPSVRKFLGEGYGFLVDNSEEGILQGLLDYKNGKLNSLKKFDAEKFNEQALQEFYDIIEK